MATKYKRTIDTIDNNRVYKIALKHYRETHCEIYCAICPYHRGENHTRDTWKNNNWKHYRKTQYKIKK